LLSNLPLISAFNFDQSVLAKIGDGDVMAMVMVMVG
jgi:hypothetical protein